MLPTNEVLCDTKEISGTNQHPFQISDSKQTTERLVGNLFSLVLANRLASEAVHTVIIRLVELPDDSSALRAIDHDVLFALFGTHLN